VTIATPFLMISRDAAEKIASAPSSAGTLALRHAPSEDLDVVSMVEVTSGTRMPVQIPREYTALNWGDAAHSGQWVRRSGGDINLIHLDMLRRVDVSMPLKTFRTYVPEVQDPGGNRSFLITHDPGLPLDLRNLGVYEFAAWVVDRDGVVPIHVEVEPETIGLEQLNGKWPIRELAQHTVMVIGLGSIGGASADALGAYGVGRLLLVDPDRFLWHNMVRHVLGRESVGRHKVDAMKDRLDGRWVGNKVEGYRLEVVNDAHYIRGMLADVDLVVCTADGIAPRRVVSHLARRAGIPAVLACVLDQGSVGEILRLRPVPRFGCLLCQRADLATRGSIDAEADQELDYGTGHVHQPMTAVGPDLHAIGHLAAKSAVATLLESEHGDHTQQLPGEHAVVGLRPAGDLAAPFDLAQPGSIRWDTIPEPRSHCPTCKPT
jgi:hypothetical protein